MANVDWDKGLPVDVLAVVARVGGPRSMMEMRGVSATWQQGYELAVTGITIKSSHDLQCAIPPSGTEAPQRFPALAKLNLGQSTLDAAWLANLRAFRKLDTLNLGTSLFSRAGTLGSRLADADMQHLWVGACAGSILH